jgi:hypothetical protein
MSTPSQSPNVQFAGDAADIGLGTIVSFWWNRRTRFVLQGLAVAAGVLLLGVAALALRPVRQETTLGFQLLFDGVERGQYPNGKRFSPSDIVATKVLQEVYRRNALERFIKFEDFKDALVVTNLNPALERLRREYQAKLQDRRLVPADRKKLEDEYDVQAKPLQGGRYTLVLDIKGPFSRWSETLAGKVLDDTLATWAEQSRDRGVFRFDLNTFSENILAEIDPDSDDYPVLLDRLRVTIERIRGNLAELARVPGARLVRVGDRKVSLGELELSLNDDVKYRLSMIEAPVYTMNFSRNRTLSGAYIREQLFRLQRETQTVQSQIAVAREGLEGYSASRAGATAGNEGSAGGLPSDSFIDRLLDLSTRGSDVSFRQDLVNEIIRLGDQEAALQDERLIYQKMQTALGETGKVAVAVRRAELEPWVQEQIKDMLQKLRRTLGEVSLLHREISERNLQPSIIYTVREPAQQVSLSRVDLRLVVMGSVAIWLAAMAGLMGLAAWREMGSNR